MASAPCLSRATANSHRPLCACQTRLELRYGEHEGLDVWHIKGSHWDLSATAYKVAPITGRGLRTRQKRPTAGFSDTASGSWCVGSLWGASQRPRGGRRNGAAGPGESAPGQSHSRSKVRPRW
ncbi:hypothetical protein M431DRAFT_478773 [Trichoderma harzianum CBS 226.95]|uniref:Uncharacterized protein n=1 Tax=Trichoderma harzianum CBS 226.95 TaxID=983964 RepID=A0A2T4AS18_TRIHA|nr:hypothetical protein M431DRAFT_478773 [Trichoderma harzianum CBS 226.95]PTB59748.1 hypothetical protein M431DRAFT_478773 [Trichoderma harzianum CBS 226.95]